jgi:hypothetical protein
MKHRNSLRDGKRHVHDGPYPETKEFLAGFAIIDVTNLDNALEWAARHRPQAWRQLKFALCWVHILHWGRRSRPESKMK